MEREIKIPVGEIEIMGNLAIPLNAQCIVIFSHGSGSSRFSIRNNYVAKMLNLENIATLLVDLLTPEEDLIYENRFNIELLTRRLVSVTEFIQQLHELKHFRIGYFGASTGAASALNAASKLNIQIQAVVSRGGRPDLSGPHLQYVKAPVLLIIGSLDHPVIEMNKEAYDKLQCIKKIEIVYGATHLFEETGTLREVAKLAAKWFKTYLVDNKF